MHVISSTHCGRPICSWNVLSKTLTGRSSVRMNALVCKTHTAQISRHFTRSTKPQASLEKPFQPALCGTRLLNPRLKQVRRTCSTRMQQTRSRTKRTSEPSVPRTCAPRSWNTQPRTKLRCATSLPLLSTSTWIWRTTPSTISCCMMLPTMRLATSTVSSM